VPDTGLKEALKTLPYALDNKVAYHSQGNYKEATRRQRKTQSRMQKKHSPKSSLDAFGCSCCGEKFLLEQLKVTDDDRLLCEEC
jgi:hypothetical protein